MGARRGRSGGRLLGGACPSKPGPRMRSRHGRRASSAWGAGRGGGRQGQGEAGSGPNIPCRLTQQPLPRPAHLRTCHPSCWWEGRWAWRSLPVWGRGREHTWPAPAGCSHPHQGLGIWSGGPDATVGHAGTPDPRALPRLSSSWPSLLWGALAPRVTAPPARGSSPSSTEACHPSTQGLGPGHSLQELPGSGAGSPPFCTPHWERQKGDPA